MPEPLAFLILIIIVALGFGFTNGLNDAANAIATVIGTRTLSPRAAIIMAAFCDFAGAMTGTAVALTIGKGIVSPEYLTMSTVFAGTLAVVLWTALATRYGMPVSLTHGLVAGLVGAGIGTSGAISIIWKVLIRVISAVGIAPILGFAGGFFVMAILMWIFKDSAPAKLTNIFGRLQILSAAFLAYTHGKNDGQMPIGVMSMALMIYHGSSELVIPYWVIIISALSISLGTAMGGWRVIRTLGLRMTALRPVHGFAASTSAAIVIEIASQLGIPVSTTHCLSTAVMGVGSTRRLSAVRWGIAKDIVLTWILTFPVCGLLGWIVSLILKAIF
jgi:PiT family inorganic phosphate transporter